MARLASKPTRQCEPMRSAKIAVLWVAMVGASLAHATIEVPAGDVLEFTDGTFDVDCEDIVINGTLNSSNASFVRVGNVTIGPSGTFNASNVNAEVSLSWTTSPGGVLNATGSTVHIVNACGNSATSFSGSTTFNNLSAVVSGHTIHVASGSEITVSGALTLKDVTLLKQGATPALLTLQPGGTQDIANVGVDGVNATNGQHLAPLLDNLINGGVANNWFRNNNPTPGPTAVTAVPVMGPIGLAVMGLLIGVATGPRRRRSGRPLPDSH